MAAIKPKVLEGEGERSHRIRITLTSQNVAALEKGETLDRRGSSRPSACHAWDFGSDLFLARR